MKLYEISDEYILAKIDLLRKLESGELDQQIFDDTLEGLAFDPETKMLNTAKLRQTALFERNAVAEVGKMNINRVKSYDTFIKRLDDYLAREMLRTDLRPKDAEIALSLRKSASVEVVDESKIPPSFLREKREVLPDKKAIMEALKNGQEVPGAQIMYSHNLQIK